MKRITIKEIAHKAGVSVGTVDRVLHKRGEVAEKTKQLVLKIAKEGNYQTNVFARNLKLNKTYHLAILLPEDNEYWKTQRKGIEDAANEYEYLGVQLQFYTFDRSNRDSFIEQSNLAIESKPDGVILAPIITDEAEQICAQLKQSDIPYVFVDSNLKTAEPLAFIGQDTIQSGYLAAKLLNIGFDHGHPAVIAIYTDFDSLNKTIDERISGFKKFYTEQGWSLSLISELKIPSGFEIKEVKEWTANNGRLHLFVPNSRTHQIVDRLESTQYEGLTRIIGYDKIQLNVDVLKDNKVDFIINQNPYRQGSLGVQALYKHLIIKGEIEPFQYMPLDILTKENVEFAN
ncbi:MAG: LacI family DNA-binding transcriptional regulator [Reichenbachiella sp.]|uniref:LacI family DNA-binding transcriptional regulator n=1 Tax=Reichenbachiella sp. TaxID=2184521 RepID=UPI003263DEFE